MTTATELTDTFRTQTLELIKQGQQATVQAAEAWAGLVTRTAPEGIDASWLTDQLPDPTTVTEQAFDFAEQLLATQREFVTSLAGAVVPVTEAATAASATGAKGTKSKK